jgi:hypothetical protein
MVVVVVLVVVEQVLPATRAAVSKGPQNGYLKEKSDIFCSTNFKLMSQIKENSINNYD